MAKRKTKPAPAEDHTDRPETDTRAGDPLPGDWNPPEGTDCEPATADVRPDGPRAPNPHGYKQDVAAGVRLLEDRRFKQVQLKFADKPSAAVREMVREAGYRWREEEQAWTKQIDPEKGWQTRADADDLFERVTAAIRAEKGITREYA